MNSGRVQAQRLRIRAVVVSRPARGSGGNTATDVAKSRGGPQTAFELFGLDAMVDEEGRVTPPHTPGAARSRYRGSVAFQRFCRDLSLSSSTCTQLRTAQCSMRDAASVDAAPSRPLLSSPSPPAPEQMCAPNESKARPVFRPLPLTTITRSRTRPRVNRRSAWSHERARAHATAHGRLGVPPFL